MEIPFHIQMIAKFYSLSKLDGNLAKGEIEKFNFHISQRNTHKIGDRTTSIISENGNDYNCSWVHVGNDYFKLIAKYDC